jgi:hypothetical protein
MVVYIADSVPNCSLLFGDDKVIEKWQTLVCTCHCVCVCVCLGVYLPIDVSLCMRCVWKVSLDRLLISVSTA